MRVLITGGSGFIGTNLVEHFLRRGDDVLNLDQIEPRNAAHSQMWRKVDLLDVAGLRAAVEAFSPEIVLHFGARTDLEGETLDDYAANVRGVENVIAALEGIRSLRRVIFASSRLVCRIGYQPRDEFDYCPSTPYGKSKAIGEQLVRSKASHLHVPWVIVRPTSIWGPWFEIPYKAFFMSVAKGRYFHPRGRTILKSFGFVGNTVFQLQRLVDLPAETINGRTFYLADYPSIDVAKMADTIQRATNARQIMSINVGILRCAALAGDLLKLLGWRNPPLTSFRLVNLLTPMTYDLEPLRALVGDLPYTMEEGVRITAEWLRANGQMR